MKVRLQITAAGHKSTFEHAGPVVHVGRDPSCELALEGEASTGVSRRHTRIELSPGGATVADDGSSNGTLLNDRKVERPVKLRAGDRIQLGYTGPTLTVLELDLSGQAPPPPPHPAGPKPVLIYGGAAAAAVVLIALGLVWLLRRTGPAPEQTGPEVVQAAVATQPARPITATTERGPALGEQSRKDKAEQVKLVEPPPPPPPPPIDEAAEVPVGTYLALPEWGPSVLLARRGDAYPWAPLRPESKVSTAQTLLSLPGYRSEVLLDSKVQLTLWGNVPPFCGFPPLLLESAAMLNAPVAGTDLDLTLEWGRVKVANRKEKGPARVRLRFLREVWDLTLPAADSEVCAELWSMLLPPEPGNPRQSLPVSLGLFTKGSVTLERGGPKPERLEMKARSRVAWVSTPGSPLYTADMSELPGWWVKPPDPKDDAVAETILVLKDWADRLNKGGEAVEAVQQAIAKSDEAAFREQGAYFLAALDGAPYLVNHLEDARHVRVRRSAGHALRAWLTRGPGRSAELGRLLQVKTNSPQRAALVLQLLHPYAEEELKRPAVYQQLITHLEDDSLAVRELAGWHLEDMAPGVAAKAPYNPADAAEQRRQVVARWKNLLPPGTVPRREAQ